MSEKQTWEEYENELFDGIPEQNGAEKVGEYLPPSSPADSSASPKEDGGLRPVPAVVGQEIQCHGESKTEAAETPASAIVPTPSKFIGIRAEAGQSSATTLDDLSPFNRRALETRAEQIDRQYEGEIIETTLPLPMLETARQWLRSKNLIWASNDIDFWTAFQYVLGSLETFSIDAVEQALIICTTQATHNPARRVAIYQELRACRAIKKIRDMEMKIKTAQVVANHVLSNPFREKIRLQEWAAGLGKAEMSDEEFAKRYGPEEDEEN